MPSISNQDTQTFDIRQNAQPVTDGTSQSRIPTSL